MPMRPVLRSSALILITLVIGRPALAQATSCRANADTASAYVGKLKLMYSVADPGATAGQGLPYAGPAAISLVTSASTCKSAVGAYNKTNGFSGKNARSSAYVVSIGTSGYAVIDPTNMRGENVLVFVYDTSWRFKKALMD